ncbi:hypothetical protein [Haliscomenobacter sp.]|uniref:hypothetical protein n=1 Tax=Haliscomenobacter sp. TaxID=2717303 RepID=UPI0035938F93
MKQQQIQSLLDKYFAGESSLQEEAQLRQLLQTEPISAEHLNYREWFQLLEEEAELSLGDDFDAKVMAAIEASNKPKPVIRTLSVAWVLRIAAVFALVATGLWWLVRSNPVEQPIVAEAEVKVIDWSKYEPKTVEEAYEVTRKALRKVATEFNEGTAIATQSIDKMGEMGKLIK